jgi:RNA ligase (TIGR02306 family)
MTELVTEGRKLVTIRKITAIHPIENADAIEAAMVDGWQVVIKKGEFSVGDFCIFFEIDSFLPASDERFSFLARNGTKTDENGVERIRLRSVKLRQTLSQGLALPIKLFCKDIWSISEYPCVIRGGFDDDAIMSSISNILVELEDSRFGIEQYLDVTKYERPDERNGGTGAGKAKTAGNFPIFIPKTDEDRVQNIFGKFSQTMKGVPFRKSLKLDGSSETIAFVSNPDFFIDKIDDVVQEWNEETQTLEVKEVLPYPFTWEEGQGIVCSRNLALKFDASTAFWKAALKDDILERLRKYCTDNNRQLALQGECMGPGIQGNRENLEEHTFFCFRIWDIDAQNFLDDAEFLVLTAILGISVVPQDEVVYFFDKYETIADALASADHASITHPIAEGDVYKSTVKVNGQTIHFKVINNKFLLKCED